MDDYRLLREAAVQIELPHMAVIRLTGADAIEWLQGQVTNDVWPLAAGEPVSFCLCSATGQIQSVIDASGLLLTCPRETAHHFLQRVEQMVIMEDVAAEDLTAQLRLVSIQGPEAQTHGEELAIRRDRTGSGGYDVWVPRDSEAAFAPILSPEAFNIARLEAGIPFFGSDYSEKTLPPELGPEFERRHVSYTKGCYVGQEILQRIHSRGHTNKTWVGLVAEAPLEIGAQVQHPDRPDAGVVTSVALSPSLGNIGAAMLRNEAATPGGLVQVQTERGEVEAEVREMPLLSFA